MDKKETNKKTIPSQAGKVDWEKLEMQENGLGKSAKQAAKAFKKRQRNKSNSREEDYNEQGIKAEMKNLTDEERASPYPPEFLADVNLLRKKIDEGRGIF